MKLKKVGVQAAIAGVLSFSALGLGVGVGTASANPGGCGDYCQVDYHGDRGGGGYGGYYGDGDGYRGYGGYGDGPDIPFFCIPFVNCPAY